MRHIRVRHLSTLLRVTCPFPEDRGRPFSRQRTHVGDHRRPHLEELEDGEMARGFGHGQLAMRDLPHSSSIPSRGTPDSHSFVRQRRYQTGIRNVKGRLYKELTSESPGVAWSKADEADDDGSL